MAFNKPQLNSFTRTFLAFFCAVTIPVSGLALYMGHVGEIAGYKVNTPGNQLPVAAVLRAVPEVSVYGQSQGIAGTTRVHITGKEAMGFHTLYVLPDNQTVIAGVPLTGLNLAGLDTADLANDLRNYEATLVFLGTQYEKEEKLDTGVALSSAD